MIDTLRRLAHRTAAFVRRDPLDRELDSELASHLAMAEDEHVFELVPAPTSATAGR